MGIAACAAADDSFYKTALDKAVKMVVPLIERHSGDMEDFLACKAGVDSDAMTRFGMVQDRITSFEDMVDLFNEYFSAAGCVRKTARFFKALFGATHDEETCPVIGR